MNFTQIGLNTDKSCYSNEAFKLPLKMKWKTKLVPYEIIWALFEDGILYLMCGGKRAEDYCSCEYIYCALDSDNGHVLWEWTEVNITPSICVVNGILIIDAGKYRIGLKDGVELWRQDNDGGRNYSAPLVYNDTVVLSHDIGLRFIDPATGRLLRSFDAERATAASCVGDKLVFGDNKEGYGGKLYCLDFATAKPVWITDLEELGNYYDTFGEEMDNKCIAGGGTVIDKRSDYNVKGHLMSFPVISGDRIYCSLTQYYAACFSLITGDVIWKTEKDVTPFGICMPVGETVYYPDLPSIYYLDAQSGKVLEHAFIDRNRVGGGWNSLPFITDHYLIQNTPNGTFIVDLQTREIVWEYTSNHRKIGPFFNPFYADGRLYMSGNDGYMYCFQTK